MKGPFDRKGKGVRYVHPLSKEEIPLRITYRFSKTPVHPPSEFDTTLITRSAQLPNKKLELFQVFGFADTISTSNLLITVHGELVYYSAAVGIVYVLRVIIYTLAFYVSLEKLIN